MHVRRCEPTQMLTIYQGGEMATRWLKTNPSWAGCQSPSKTPARHERDQTLLDAALSASFVGRRKPWHIVLITDPVGIEDLGRVIPQVITACVERPKSAVVICGDRSVQKQLGPLVANCCDATDSLLYAAHARSLRPHCASLYGTGKLVEQLRIVLGIPKHVIPFSIVAFCEDAGTAVGVSDANPLIHLDSWES